MYAHSAASSKLKWFSYKKQFVLQLFISTYLSIRHGQFLLNGTALPDWVEAADSAENAYRKLEMSYPKFFKMDMLCKWAIIGAELLLKTNEQYRYEGMDKMKIAVVMMTGNGCIDVDKKYLASAKTVASPALFVYTLPNIMLGEICIKHGFKGEQLCMMSETPDAEELFFWVNDLLLHKDMDACLCGWIDVTEAGHEMHFFWVDKKKGAAFTKENMARCFKK